MTKTYDEILSTEDLENLDSFLKAWDNVIVMLTAMAPNVADKVDADRRRECDDLRRKLAVAIHYSKEGSNELLSQ